MNAMLKAGIYLNGILPLMEDLVAFDRQAAATIAGKRLILQFEVKNGAAAHLIIRDQTIRHGTGKHPLPNMRLRFSTPERFVRMFEGENVIPCIRNGLFHLNFLMKQFPVLGDRLTYFLEGDGKNATDRETFDFLVKIGLHAMLSGMAAVATGSDEELRDIADSTPFGTLLIRILPDGPYGTFSKLRQNGKSVFTATMNQPFSHANAVMEFTSPEAAKQLIDGKLNAVTAIGLGKDIKISGLLPLIDKASIFLYQFAKIMA